MKTTRLIFFSLLLGLFSSPAFPRDLPRGQVIDKVICRADVNQSYALYLPHAYTPAQKWPILYAFDAGARGILPVERFSDAAKKYGYIVAASNNARNGPNEPLVTAVRALLEDTQSRFSIDDRRIYLAGFSGGARVAISIGFSLKGSVAGIIASSAGFPQEIQPSASVPFVLFGTAGTEDFNLPEMRQLDQALDRFDVPRRIEVFDGGHDWPPASLCLDAIEWIELQAMKSGRRVKEETFITEQFQKGLDRIRADVSSRLSLAAYRETVAVIRDFKGYRDISALEQSADALRNSKETKQALKQEKDEAEKQNLWSNRFQVLKSAIHDSDPGSSEARDVREFVGDLRRKSGAGNDSMDRRVARRCLALFMVQLMQEASQNFTSQRYALAALNFSLGTIIRPDSPELYYNLASAEAMDGRRGEALAALKEALHRGFKPTTLLETDPHLALLRKDKEFLDLIETVKKPGRP